MPGAAKWVSQTSGDWRKDDYQLERQVQEPGHPRGWYLFGPNADGIYMALHLWDAKRHADEFINDPGAYYRKAVARIVGSEDK